MAFSETPNDYKFPFHKYNDPSNDIDAISESELHDLLLKQKRISQVENSSKPGSAGQCRNVLDWILRPIDANLSIEWADHLIRTFGSAANAAAANVDIIQKALGGNMLPALQLSQFHQTMTYMLGCKIRNSSIALHWVELIEYLQQSMGHLRVEQARVIFFNARFRFISNERLGDGDVSEVVFYPRQVARRAVIAQASGAILVHNHPTGNLEMSQADKSMTFAVEDACKAVGVGLYDHLVISRDGYTSFRDNNPLWARCR